MYRLYVLPRALKDIAGLPKEYARLVGQHIDRLQQDPRPADSKKLRGSTNHSLRVGTYRILYDIDDSTRSVTVYRVKHRSEAYR